MRVTPLDDVRRRLVAAGFGDAQVIDETFSRSWYVTDPDGVVLVVHEPMADFYGYPRHDADNAMAERTDE